MGPKLPGTHSIQLIIETYIYTVTVYFYYFLGYKSNAYPFTKHNKKKYQFTFMTNLPFCSTPDFTIGHNERALLAQTLFHPLTDENVSKFYS